MTGEVSRQESFGRAASSDAAALVNRLQEDVVSIVSRSQMEIQNCFDIWLAQELNGAPASVGLTEDLPMSCNLGYPGNQGQDMPALPNSVLIVPQADLAIVPDTMTHGTVAMERPLIPKQFKSAPKKARTQSLELLSPTDGQWRKMIQKTISSNKQSNAKGSQGKRSHAGSYVTAKKVEEVKENMTFSQRIVSHKAYEFFTVALIVVNAVFLGVEVQVMCSKAREDFESGVPIASVKRPFFDVTTTLFCVAFVSELGIRMFADGTQFFRTADYLWNWFDTLIVSFSVLEQFLGLLGGGGELKNVSVLRVLRIVRVVKVLRIIRLLAFFRELRMMISSILGCFKSLCWAVLVLLAVFYIFGISFASGTFDYCWIDDQCGEETEALRFRFGSLDMSMMSLFLAITGGIDWGDLYFLMKPLPSIHSLMFLFFISFSSIAMLNVVTGIFVENALLSGTNDREVVITEQIAEKNKNLQNMMNMFMEMDDDQSGSVTIEEFEKHLDDERAIAYFEAMKLDVTEVGTLCMMLDQDQSGNIDMEEFVVGCEKLKGESRTLDVAIVKFELRALTQTFLTFAEMIEREMLHQAAERDVARLQGSAGKPRPGSQNLIAPIPHNVVV